MRLKNVAFRLLIVNKNIYMNIQRVNTSVMETISMCGFEITVSSHTYTYIQYDYKMNNLVVECYAELPRKHVTTPDHVTHPWPENSNKI